MQKSTETTLPLEEARGIDALIAELDRKSRERGIYTNHAATEFVRRWRSEKRWVGEREAAVAVLRRICDEHGDNDWDDGLSLADIIDKHLGRYLDGSIWGQST